MQRNKKSYVSILFSYTDLCVCEVSNTQAYIVLNFNFIHEGTSQFYLNT